MYTIGSFLREEELTGLKLMTDTADLQAEITNINIIDNPDSYDWLSSGDFLLTTGYFLRDDEAMQCQLVRELSELGCVGLAIKTRRYLDVIPEAMLEEANRLGFPLINIPVQYPLSKICKVVFGRLSGGAHTMIGQRQGELAADGDEDAHVEGSPYDGSSACDCTTAPQGAAVAIERGDACQGSDLASAEAPQFG